jgi:hypothetical protein
MKLYILFFLLVISMCAEPGSKAEYIGGTIDQFAPGGNGTLRTDNAEALIYMTSKGGVSVPYERVNLLEYGQNASRRIVLAVVVSPLFLLSKSRKHFLTVGYRDDSGRQQAMVFRVDKSKVRVVLASLEARTGQKVQYQDDEARKAGKG